ncbi:DHHA1 domain-containing protein [Nitrospirillum bahiense]|uniref:NanoRNase/pAp phosphatase (C-di-AMP/oligoRNAs hydrolase) n=1 Tax=Nitrospirillum amazonense TaxID=28077 RepID=A0A560F1V5_9PROT|nr:DHHA1 domain-containing protein [Nitrospirillum amazonense]TWB15577.1 nanoRNase/pAp phosphatase (c-di-AMP/oligoRNAs hydrolase) [Nitrospirillum amazonense]
MGDTVCIYHGNCADGFGAAWAVRKALGDGCEYIPALYGAPAPDVTAKHVILVDFSFKRPVLMEMAKVALSILVLDHHKTAAEDLAGFMPPEVVCGGYHGMRDLAFHMRDEVWPIRAIFDMERSGAMIAWDYFHPGETAPKLIQHIQDRDLWRFALPHTREIQAAVFSYPYNFEVWDGLVEQAEFRPEFLAAEGMAIERKHFKDIDELLKVSRRTMRIGGELVPVANLPYTLASDAANQLADGWPFAATYSDGGDKRVFSLRSRPGGADVSVIAKAYGGGGHRNAAGFQMPIGWEGDDMTSVIDAADAVYNCWAGGEPVDTEMLDLGVALGKTISVP